MIISRSPLVRAPPSLQQQRVVVGQEGAQLGRPVRQREEHVRHEAGLLLHLLGDALAQVGRAGRVAARAPVAADRRAVDFSWRSSRSGGVMRRGTAAHAGAHTGRRAPAARRACLLRRARPASMATTRSACSMVDSRCAMTSVVRSCISTSSAVLHRALGFAVERRRRFVEDQDRRVLVDRARDRQPLALAARQLAAVVADLAVDALAAATRRSRAGWRRAAPRARARVSIGTPSATLAATVSLNSTTSWLTSANCGAARATSHRAAARRRGAARPRVGSMKRGSRLTSDDLPAPDGPTSATVSPAAMRERKVRPARRPGRRDSAASRASARCGRRARATLCVPPRSAAPSSIRSTLRSSAVSAAHDRRHHVGQVVDRRQQHQHRGDEGDEAAHRLAAGAAFATARPRSPPTSRRPR